MFNIFNITILNFNVMIFLNMFYYIFTIIIYYNNFYLFLIHGNVIFIYGNLLLLKLLVKYYMIKPVHFIFRCLCYIAITH